MPRNFDILDVHFRFMTRTETESEGTLTPEEDDGFPIQKFVEESILTTHTAPDLLVVIFVRRTVFEK